MTGVGPVGRPAKSCSIAQPEIAEEAREGGSAIASFDEDFRKLNVALRRV